MRMIIIRFPDKEAEAASVKFLVGRFSFKGWANGDLMVPDEALPALEYKETLKARFRQIDIWLTSSPLEVL